MGFQKICRDLKEFGETMQVKADKEGITFTVQGDLGAGNVLLKPREAEKPEEKVSLIVHESVTATFALRYLVNFAKAAPLCGCAELGLGPDAPLMVKYDLESSDNGHMQFYLAPKIDEWGESVWERHAAEGSMRHFRRFVGGFVWAA